VEAVEAGAKVLLVDEDTAATNFMIRDRRMQELIAKNKEPITPFIDKVRLLYQDLGVSVLLVMGGSGDYFDIADRAIAMENFLPYDVTDRAKAIAAEYATGRESEGGEMFGKISSRILQPKSLDPSSGKRDIKVKVRDVDAISFGKEDIDLSSVEQIAESSQLRAIAAALVYLKQEYLNASADSGQDGQLSLVEILDRVMADVREQGLDVLTRFPEGDLAEFRRLELAAAINRLRTLQVRI
jgi:predicted ABC-class ATPase